MRAADKLYNALYDALGAAGFLNELWQALDIDAQKDIAGYIARNHDIDLDGCFDDDNDVYGF